MSLSADAPPPDNPFFLSEKESYGLQPANKGWVEWFAWRPVKACGRWRWLVSIQRRRDYFSLLAMSPLNPEFPWQYVAGRAHRRADARPGNNGQIHRFNICKNCQAKFID